MSHDHAKKISQLVALNELISKELRRHERTVGRLRAQRHQLLKELIMPEGGAPYSGRHLSSLLGKSATWASTTLKRYEGGNDAVDHD